MRSPVGFTRSSEKTDGIPRSSISPGQCNGGQFTTVHVERDVHIDNAKFTACVMTVTVHIASYNCGDTVLAPGSAVIKALWFHMPFFALLSGAVAKESSHPQKLLRYLVVPLATFVFVLQPLMNFYIMRVFPGVRINGRLSFEWTTSRSSVSTLLLHWNNVRRAPRGP
jgi:fucose 4-O-acetylase-like acetyltransferase